jgi:hypothetical protein
MSEVAVQGCHIKISSTAGSISAISVVPSNSPSTVNFADNKGIFFDKITVQITTATITPTTPIAGTTNTGILDSGSIDINGTADNTLDSNNKKAVQKGDKATKTLTFSFTTTSTPPSTTPVDLPVTVEVDDAGQTDVIAS